MALDVSNLMSVLNLTFQAGSIGFVLIGACAWAGRYFANRAIDTRKAEFERQLERTKSELSQELEITKNRLSAEAEKIRAELSREADTHRFRLKKLELLFDREVEAANKFLQLHRAIRPMWRHPDMDWSDAVREVTDQLAKTETQLSAFLVEHGTVMAASARVALQKAIKTASNHKFDADVEYQTNYLEGFLEELAEVERELLAAVRA
jgi:hypothetical protein